MTTATAQKPVAKSSADEQLLLGFIELREDIREKQTEYKGMLALLKEKYKGQTVVVGDFIITSKLVKRKGFEVGESEYYVTRIRRRKTE